MKDLIAKASEKNHHCHKKLELKKLIYLTRQKQ